MALPFPHGSASGQIAHNSIYDLGVTPGSSGGKFIGWGEEGTSAAANRAHWALSENIDYVYQRLAEDKSIPVGQSIPAGHGGIDKYQLTGDVFVGDGTYPITESEGLMLLFAVLDQDYNELTDDDGNEVLVYLVRDSTQTTNVYKDAAVFVTDPYVYFEAGGSPYTIPDAQDVKILYGEKGSLENLPVDAFTRFKLNSAAEAEAGVFLQDGSRPMVGDGDWDGNKLINLLEATSGAGADLLINGLQELKFKDQHLAAGVPISQISETALYQPTGVTYNPSILGALNGQVEGSEVLRGNQSLNRTGSFTSNPTGPALDYPELNMLVNGEVIDLPASTLSLSGVSTGNVFVYFNPSTGALENTNSALNIPSGGIPLWKGAWSGSAWSSEVDIRWPSNRSGTHEAWYVGNGVGADFTDLDMLLEVINTGFISMVAGRTHKVQEIVVCGTLIINSTFYVPSGWVLRGAGKPGGGREHIIQTSTTFGPNEDVISAGTYNIIKDLKVIWGNTSAHQGSSNCGMWAGEGTIVDGVEFDDGSYSFNDCIQGTICRVDNCNMEYCSYQGYGVAAYGAVRIEHCNLGPYLWGSGVGCASLQYSNNVVDNCIVTDGGPGSWFFRVSDRNNTIRNCHQFLNGLSIPFIYVQDGSEDTELHAENNHLHNSGGPFIKSEMDNASRKLRVWASGNYLFGFDDTAFLFNDPALHADSVVYITDNIIEDQDAGYCVYVKNTRAYVNNNSIIGSSTDGFTFILSYFEAIGNYLDVVGVGIYTSYASECIIADNTIWPSEDGVTLDSSGATVIWPARISGNRFLSTNANYAMLRIKGVQGVSITGNTFGVSTISSCGAIKLEDNGSGGWPNYTSIIGNTFHQIRGRSGESYSAAVLNKFGDSCTISGNTFYGCGDYTGEARDTYVIRAYSATANSITGNSINGLKGSTNAGRYSYCIAAEYGASIVGNTIMVDLTESTVPVGDVYGIEGGEEGVVSGNVIEFTGSGTGPPTWIYGINVWSAVAVVGNFIGSWNITSASTQKAIVGGAYDQQVVIGNLAMKWDIDFNLTSLGMVLGNVCRSTGSVLTGANATSGNVSNP